MVDRFSGWARARGPIAGVLVGLATVAGWAMHGPAPGRDLGILADALGRAAGGARVDPADVRWQPSEGIFADAVLGRWALFLARAPGEDTRDVWRARVRVSPDGDALDVRAAYDITSTPIGDDHELVVRGDHAAFATRAYGQEQSVTVLALAGEGTQNKTATLPDRWMAALTNLQKTGTTTGLGRVDVTFESPARAVGLELGADALDLSLFGLAGGYPREGAAGSARGSRTVVDLATGDLAPPLPMIHADASMHLPKRFSHWVVDTLRAVPWIGPAPVAWVEDEALALRDAYRRVTFQPGHDATDVVATAESASSSARHVAGVRRRGALAAGEDPDHLEVPRACGGRVGRTRRALAAPRSGRRRGRAVPFLPDVRSPRRGPALRPGLAGRHGSSAAGPPDGGRSRRPRAAHGPSRNGPHPAGAGGLPPRRGRVQRRLQDRARPLRDDGQKAGSPSARSWVGDRHGSRRRARRLRDVGDRPERRGHRGDRRRRESIPFGRTSTRSSTTARRTRPVAISGASPSPARARRPSARVCVSRRAATSSTPGAMTSARHPSRRPCRWAGATTRCTST